MCGAAGELDLPPVNDEIAMDDRSKIRSLLLGLVQGLFSGGGFEGCEGVEVLDKASERLGAHGAVAEVVVVVVAVGGGGGYGSGVVVGGRRRTWMDAGAAEGVATDDGYHGDAYLMVEALLAGGALARARHRGRTGGGGGDGGDGGGGGGVVGEGVCRGGVAVGEGWFRFRLEEEGGDGRFRLGGFGWGGGDKVIE